jgi:uncharacterized membrane protein YgcG
MYAGALLAALGLLRRLVAGGAPRERALDQIEQQQQQGPAIPPEQAETLATLVVVISVAGSLIAIALWISMAILNRRGRQWARIVATVLGVLNVLSSLLGVGSGGGDAFVDALQRGVVFGDGEASVGNKPIDGMPSSAGDNSPALACSGALTALSVVDYPCAQTERP